MFETPWGFFPIFHVIIFAIVIGIISFQLLKALWIWYRNQQSPIERELAEIVSKRSHVSPMGNQQSSTSYYVTFEFGLGERREFRLPAKDYGLLAEGDKGTLTFRGSRFISFER